jgi:hypothetical protein
MFKGYGIVKSDEALIIFILKSTTIRLNSSMKYLLSLKNISTRLIIVRNDFCLLNLLPSYHVPNVYDDVLMKYYFIYCCLNVCGGEISVND